MSKTIVGFYDVEKFASLMADAVKAGKAITPELIAEFQAQAKPDRESVEADLNRLVHRVENALTIKLGMENDPAYLAAAKEVSDSKNAFADLVARATPLGCKIPDLAKKMGDAVKNKYVERYQAEIQTKAKAAEAAKAAVEAEHRATLDGLHQEILSLREKLKAFEKPAKK